MPTIVAVDIGSTQMRAASYNSETLKPIKQKKIATLASEPGGLGSLTQVIEEVWPVGDTVEAIGPGSPGPLDPHTGYLLAPPNNPEWRNFPLAPNVSKHFGVKANLDNDANLAGLAEYRFGAGKGHHNVLFITVNTGIGASVIIDDRLLQGFHGLAAELGHIIIDTNGPHIPVVSTGISSLFRPTLPS